MAHYQPTFGSISHGTMRPEDLIPAFTDELKLCIGKRRGYKHYRLVIKDAKKLRDFDSEDAGFILEELFDALNEFAPDYGYFGSHPGDGSDYGFWLTEELEHCFDGLQVKDLSEIPNNYRGEVMHINDHGNTTLYYKSARKLTEIWALV